MGSVEKSVPSKFTGRHITLEALLDSPGLTPSPLSDSVNAVQTFEPLDQGSLNESQAATIPPSNCQSSTAEQKSCIPQLSDAERLSLLRDHCIELLFVLRNQDVNGYFLSFSPKNGPREECCTGLLALEKKLLLEEYKTLNEFKSDVNRLFSAALRCYPQESPPHSEAQRLLSVTGDWFDSLPADRVQLLNSESTRAKPTNPTKQLGLQSVLSSETCLGILNPDNCGLINRTERVRTLGEEVGPLRSGLYLLPNGGYREDRRNKVIPYTYLDYGPFYSFAPHYDSGASHCTPEAHQLVLGTTWLPARTAYLSDVPSPDPSVTDDAPADEITEAMRSEAVRSALAVGDHQLAVSLAVAEMEERSTARLAVELDQILPGPEVDDDCVFSMCLANALTKVDRLRCSDVNPKTEDQVDRFKRPLDASQNSVPNVDLDHVDEPQDACPTDDLPSLNTNNNDDNLADQLSESATDLFSLCRAQYRRLSDTSQGSVQAGLTVVPSQTESEIAYRLVGRLLKLTKHARPRDLVHPYTVRRAMGLPPDIAPLPDDYRSLTDSAPSNSTDRSHVETLS